MYQRQLINQWERTRDKYYKYFKIFEYILKYLFMFDSCTVLFVCLFVCLFFNVSRRLRTKMHCRTPHTLQCRTYSHYKQKHKRGCNCHESKQWHSYRQPPWLNTRARAHKFTHMRAQPANAHIHTHTHTHTFDDVR